jgi:hypothetical protein
MAMAYAKKDRKLQLLLGPGAFTDTYGVENPELPGLEIQRIPPIGDVSGDGGVSAYDASLILQALVKGTHVFPINDAAAIASAGLAALGFDCDIMMLVANADNSKDGLTAQDASLVLKMAAGLIDDFSVAALAPIVGSPQRNGRLEVNSYDQQKLEVSIDLNDVTGVHAADIDMAYNPQVLTVTDVSGAASISGWLLEQGTTASGKLRISMAGLSQPTEDGSLVTVSFDAASKDAIKQLNITEFKLNGGRLKTNIENLPKAFTLLQNYPNPFNPETWIPYRLVEAADVAITIYNVNGQMVRRLELGNRMPGHYVDRTRAAYWDGRNESGEKVSSGIYFYQLQAGRDNSVRKMIVVK